MMHGRRTPRKRDHRRGRRIALALGCALAAGCPSRFDLRADPVAVRAAAPGADPAIGDAYKDAKARLDAGRVVEARDAFRALRMAHPADPVAAASALWEARADLSLGEAPAAAALVEPLAAAPAGDPVGERARFLLGLAVGRAGDAARARALLVPFAPLVSGGGDEAAELHAILAAADAKLGFTDEALRELEAFYFLARPVEQAYVRDQATELALALPDAEVLRRMQGSPDGLAGAVLDPRAAAILAHVDPSAARALLDRGAELRRRFGFPESAPVVVAPPMTRAIGVVLPLSGRNHLVGERALRGALLAAGVVPEGADAGAQVQSIRRTPAAPIDVRVRDSGSQPEQAVAAVEELAREGVAAVMGPPDRAEAAAVLARCAALGIPVIDLSPDAASDVPGGAERQGRSFKLVRPNPLRAAALAERAVALGARRVAVLRPDNAYGKAMAEAWSKAIAERGATVAGTLTYGDKATTFIAQAKQLAALHVDAIFVPAPASQLESIAAQLAASGVTRAKSVPGHKAERSAPRIAALFATADGLSTRLLARAGRYLEGAVLAPVFFPADDVSDAGARDVAGVVQRFRDAYGDEPGAADALAWDAMTTLRAALGALAGDAGATREGLAERVAAERGAGLTGELGFGAAGERAGSPLLFLVEDERIHRLR